MNDRAATMPPQSRREDVRETIHGVEVADPYRWLEEGASAETRAWIAAQTEHARALLDSPRRERIRRRLAELMRVDWVSLPIERRGRYFFLRRSADSERGVIYVRRALEGIDEVLVDPNSMDPQRLLGVEILDVTRDGRLMAYGVRRGGEDEQVVRVMDVERRADLPDELPRRRYYNNVSFTRDGAGFYYTVFTHGGPRLRFHRLETRAEDDAEIFGRDLGPDKGIGARVSFDGKYLLIGVYHGSAAEKTELYFQRLDPPGPITPIVNDIDAQFFGGAGGDMFFLVTNWNAPNRRILRVDLNDPARAKWREIVPERESVMQSFALTGGRLIVEYLENVQCVAKIFDENGGGVREVSLPRIRSAGMFTGRWDSPEVFFAFSGLDLAPAIYRYDVASGEQRVWWRVDAPVDLSQFETRQEWYQSKDGTRVPMFVFHRRGLTIDGARPTILTGYGGYGMSWTPSFSAIAIAWAEAGGVFAVANLRAVGEFGESWHRAGYRDKKQNVFDDFIAAAEWLIRSGYTRPDKLAISGGSNGGLLVGAAMTQRPELFRAVVCHRPLLDMVRYHKFLVAPLWISEYGCADDAEQFRYLHAYSPYHRVRRGEKYPAVLFVTGDSDTRVDPLHARKMTAMLQSASASGHPVLLNYRAEAGHLSTVPLSTTIDEAADELSFLLAQLDVQVAAQ